MTGVTAAGRGPAQGGGGAAGVLVHLLWVGKAQFCLGALLRPQSIDRRRAGLHLLASASDQPS